MRTNRVDIYTDDSSPVGGLITSGSLDLNINLFESRLGKGKSSFHILGLGVGTNVLGVDGSLSYFLKIIVITYFILILMFHFIYNAREKRRDWKMFKEFSKAETAK